MIVLTYILCYLAALCYLVAAVKSVHIIRFPEQDDSKLTTRMLIIGLKLYVLCFVLRWYHWRTVPMTTITDILILFIVLSTVVAMTTLWGASRRVLLLFCMPPLALLAILDASTAHQYLTQAPPHAVRGLPLLIHVGLAFLAYAMYFVASIVSVAYAYQARCLKNRHTSNLSRQLLPLEKLDEILFRQMGLGYIFFGIAVGTGIAWVFFERELLGDTWWASPKIILSWVMLVFYAIVFHSRKWGLLRGPKLAYLVISGYVVLVVTYLVLGVMNMVTHNFWSGTS